MARYVKKDEVLWWLKRSIWTTEHNIGKITSDEIVDSLQGWLEDLPVYVIEDAPTDTPKVERRLIFSERLAVADECEKWIAENNLAESPMAVLTYLNINGLLDEQKVRYFIKTNKKDGGTDDMDLNCESIIHKTSEVVCLNCLHRWFALRPDIAMLREIECPKCGHSGFVIETGETARDEKGMPKK